MFARSFISVSLFTLVSRISGFVRDILVARFMGVSASAEMFFIALKLPNLFRRIFAEGAFNSVFVPLYNDRLEAVSEQSAKKLAHNIYSWLFLIIISLTIVIELAMPLVIYILAPGFTDDSSMTEKTIYYSRITFPYLLFIAISNFIGAILGSKLRFAGTAFMPVFLNLSLIAAIYLTYSNNSIADYALSLSIAVFVAGVIQLVWMIFLLRRAGVSFSFFRLKPQIDADTKFFFRKIIPGFIAAGIVQINMWVDTVIATFFSGAVAYLYYADRVAQLPLSLIGTALGTVLLPILSKSLSNGDNLQTNKLYNKALVLVFLLSVPAMFGLFALSTQVIQILFERGSFDANASYNAAIALMAYAVGMPAFCLVKIYSNCYFSLKDTKTPVKCAIKSLVANISLSLLLVFLFVQLDIAPHLAIALATSISGFVNLYFLHKGLQQHDIFTINSTTKSKFIKILAVSIAMYVLLEVFFAYFAFTLLTFVTAIALAIIFYFVTCYILGLLRGLR